MTTRIVLLVEDNPADARLLLQALAGVRSGEFDIVSARRLSEALERLRQSHVDVVLLDLSLPDSQGSDTLECLLKAAPSAPIVVLTGSYDEKLGLKAVEWGAQDYLLKDHISGDTVARALRYAIERHRLLDRSRELARAREALLEDVAHELRGPIGGLETGLDLLAGSYGQLDADELARILGASRRAVTRLRSFVDHMLSAAAIQSGNLRIEPLPVDLRALVEGVLQDSATLLNARQQRLECRLPDERVTVMADRVHAGRALLNLVSNASKYGPPGGTIALCARVEAANVRVAVIDHGGGIPPERQPDIFERFFRAGHERNGVGLGLSIVKGIVEAHGGEVGFSSVPNVETTFWLTLPLATLDRGRA